MHPRLLISGQVSYSDGAGAHAGVEPLLRRRRIAAVGSPVDLGEGGPLDSDRRPRAGDGAPPPVLGGLEFRAGLVVLGVSAGGRLRQVAPHGQGRGWAALVRAGRAALVAIPTQQPQPKPGQEEEGVSSSLCSCMSAGEVVIVMSLGEWL